MTDWNETTFGDLFDIGSSKRVLKSDWKREGVPFYRAREIVKLSKNGEVDNELFISEEMFKRYAEKHGAPEEGDLMVTAVGTLGICYVVKSDDKFYFKDASVLWFKNKRKINVRFIEYAFKSDLIRKQIDSSQGATVGTYTIGRAKNTAISVPPLPEQKRIVAILDEVFAGITKAVANAEKNLTNARELFESYLNNVFTQKGEGWVEKPLGDICAFVRGPFGGSLKKSCFVDDGYAVYEQQHAINNQFVQIRYFIDKSKFDEMTRFELRPGDLVMSCSGTMGRVAIVPKGIRQGIINQALLKLSPSPAIAVEFLKFWMESMSFQEQITLYSKGVAIKNVASVKILKMIDVPVPSISVQNNIVSKLNNFMLETQQLETIYQQKLTALAELKQSILQKTFNGELTSNSKAVGI